MIISYNTTPNDMLNREYQIRAKRYGIGQLVAEGILRRDPEDPRFYRPAERVSPQRPVRKKKFTGAGQMELFEEPLADVLPEAYDCTKF